MTKNDLNLIIDTIFKIRNRLDCFDFPDYGGLSKIIIKKLSSEAVDAGYII